MKIFRKLSSVAVVIVSLLGVFGPLPALAATQVDLGTADGFSVLSGASLVDSNLSTIISGDVGMSPGTSFGALTSAEVAGTIWAVDGTGPDGLPGSNPALVGGAQTDLTAAYIDAAGQGPATAITGDLGTFMGGTLAPGVYNSGSSIGLTGTVTLDAAGDANAVFIFQAGSTLTTAAGSEVALINGAQACNVFWQVGSSATLGVGSIFKGNIIAFSSITDNGGSVIEGRLLARNGTVTLDDTTVTNATCVVPPGGGGSSTTYPPPVFPLINVVKIPDPLALPSGPGSVTYTYTVTNIGEIAMSLVEVDDNMCDPTVFISGDEDDDSMLDVEEEWVYECTRTVSETETNTVTACGRATGPNYGATVCDSSNATVVVGAPIIPPLIHLVKRPNVFVLPVGGGPVTYSYSVTNPGTEPLHNVSITDDECTGLPGRVVGHPGDLNNNDLLESNETWQFTCQTNLTRTTTNIGTAEGSANGITVIDFSPATVLVVVPGLPDTGSPDDGTTMWLLLVVSSFASGSLVTHMFWRQRKVTGPAA